MAENRLTSGTVLAPLTPTKKIISPRVIGAYFMEVRRETYNIHLF